MGAETCRLPNSVVNAVFPHLDWEVNRSVPPHTQPLANHCEWHNLLIQTVNNGFWMSEGRPLNPKILQKASRVLSTNGLDPSFLSIIDRWTASTWRTLSVMNNNQITLGILFDKDKSERMLVVNFTFEDENGGSVAISEQQFAAPPKEVKVSTSSLQIAYLHISGKGCTEQHVLLRDIDNCAAIGPDGQLTTYHHAHVFSGLSSIPLSGVNGKNGHNGHKPEGLVLARR